MLSCEASGLVGIPMSMLEGMPKATCLQFWHMFKGFVLLTGHHLSPQGTHPEPENYLLTREGIAENLGPPVSWPNVVIHLWERTPYLEGQGDLVSRLITPIKSP